MIYEKTDYNEAYESLCMKIKWTLDSLEARANEQLNSSQTRLSQITWISLSAECRVLLSIGIYHDRVLNLAKMIDDAMQDSIKSYS
jgi:hypothetical protein